jgi:uncharacterized protein (DUF488 family)
MGSIYTIGSSIHAIDEFMALLNKYKINAVADVRSVPYSKHTPQYNREKLSGILKENQINYLDFNKEFGARRRESEAYTNGIVDFKKVVNLPEFLYGIERINEGMSKGYNIVLLCAEKDPINCHRFFLVSKALVDKLSINIDHILYDGSAINHHDLEKEMVQKLYFKNDLFNDHRTLLETAYERIGKKRRSKMNNCIKQNNGT